MIPQPRADHETRPLRRGGLRERPHPHTQDRTLPSSLPGKSPHWLASGEGEQKGAGGAQSTPPQQGTTQKELAPHVVLPQGTGGGKLPHATSCNASVTTATKRMIPRAVGARAMTEHATDPASRGGWADRAPGERRRGGEFSRVVPLGAGHHAASHR